MSDKGWPLGKNKMLTIIVWTLTLLYTFFVIYISTATLPAELPEETDGSSGGGANGNDTGGSGVTPVNPPPEPDPILRPIYSVRDRVPNFQVFANIGIYLVFGLLLIISLKTIRKVGLPMAFLACSLLGLLLSLSMEFTQSFVERVTDINDVIANTSGTLMGAFAGAMIIYGYRNHTDRSKAKEIGDLATDMDEQKEEHP